MTIETFLSIVCVIGVAISYLVYRYCRENVYLTYKEQKVGGKK